MDKKKILLVDDVKLFLELGKTFFNRGKFDLLTATTGTEALDLARSELPDLIFLDMYMPGMDGDEVCLTIKSDPLLAKIPVVMVTSGGHKEEVERCHNADCDEILLKPVTRHQFLATANRYLKLSEREGARLKARLEVRYGPDLNLELTDFSVNLSTGGIFLETDNPLPPKTPLLLELKLPDREEKIVCHGRVAWSNAPLNLLSSTLPPGMGIQFEGLSLDDLHAVRDYIQERHPERIDLLSGVFRTPRPTDQPSQA